MSDFSSEVCSTCPRCKQRFSRDDSVTCPNGCYDDERYYEQDRDEDYDEEVEVDLCLNFDPADQLYEESKENKNRGDR